MKSVFLGAFAKLRKATIILVMSVCLSILMEQLDSDHYFSHVCPSVWNKWTPTIILVMSVCLSILMEQMDSDHYFSHVCPSVCNTLSPTNILVMSVRLYGTRCLRPLF